MTCQGYDTERQASLKSNERPIHCREGTLGAENGGQSRSDRALDEPAPARPAAGAQFSRSRPRPPAGSPARQMGVENPRLGREPGHAELFLPLPPFQEVSDFHCVTTWTQFDMEWAGW